MDDFRMPDLNYVVIAGNLTRDPSFRKTTNGTSVANFWIASNRKFKDNNGQWRDSVCYVGVVAWYKLAENCANNLRKGCSVIIEGELQSRSINAVAGFVKAKADEQPMILVWEDLQWMDNSSFRVLEKLCSIVERAPLFLILVFRPKKEGFKWTFQSEDIIKTGTNYLKIDLN